MTTPDRPSNRADDAGLGTQLGRIEDRLVNIEPRLLKPDDVDRLLEATEGLRREMEALRRLDSGSRMLEIEESLRGQLNVMRQLGDQWAELVNPQLKAGRLHDLNRAVDDLSARLQKATYMVVVSYLLVLVLAVALLR
ncbi:hypothetical protein [Aquihabitans sp. McL0605]|uniref:hypothetical protein n=1 Tax=Aquihabitans sp. McL0605 TaxID=3415671 RepID=UPI003CEB61A1